MAFCVAFAAFTISTFVFFFPFIGLIVIKVSTTHLAALFPAGEWRVPADI
jgi:hypothetical protein|tara:strand:+ start:170 stop:319 length:150 start_codon:yes stop_codon:yes gene_type:complete